MRFKRIRLTNIRSYKDQEIIFPEGSLLLSGDIGSGKTTILMALEYALFGLQPGQKGNALLRNNESIGEVTLELEVQGQNILIERKLKRTPRGVSNEYAALTVDGEKFESSVTEIKSKIVSILGYPPEFVKKNNLLYRFTVHTAQEQMKEIILEDPQNRINILRHVFGVDKYRLIKDNLSILINSLKIDSKVLQGEILELEKHKENLAARKAHITELDEKISIKKGEFQIKIDKRKEAEIEIRAIEKDLEDKRFLEQEIEKTKIHLSTKKELLMNLEKDEEEIAKLLSNSNQTFNQETLDQIISSLKKEKEELEKLNTKNFDLLVKFSQFEKEITENLLKKERIFKIEMCPTCLQDVSEHHKHNILNEAENKISSVKNQITSIEKERTDLFQLLILKKKQIAELEESRWKMEFLRARQEQIERAKTKLTILIKQKESLLKDKTLLVNHLDNLKDKTLAYFPLESKFKAKESQLEQIKSEERSLEIALAELVRELHLSEREKTLLESLIQRKEASKQKLYEINELCAWLSSQFLNLIDLTERKVLLKLRKEFSSLFRKWFIMLISDNSLDSQVDENFTPVILQGETEMDYSFLSGGERTAVALAYRLALNQTINSIIGKIRTKGLIVLDEPSDGFSEAQIMKIRDILEEINAEQLIIVSHEQKVESFVDNVIKITKDADESSIAEILTQKTINPQDNRLF